MSPTVEVDDVVALEDAVVAEVLPPEWLGPADRRVHAASAAIQINDATTLAVAGSRQVIRSAAKEVLMS